jgi:hypothetical protein
LVVNLLSNEMFHHAVGEPTARQEQKMSFDKLLRDTVREEVARAVAPLAAALAQLQSQSQIVSRLAGAFGSPIKARVGRPPKALSVGGGKTAKASKDGARACALEDCGRPARSKGYCAAHYQKYRMLEKTGRLPSDWKEYAPVGSVKNLTLPRGRAGAKALAEAKKK